MAPFFSSIFSPDRPRLTGLLSLWGVPLVLNLLVISGLISALLYESLGAVWSWFALGVPVAVMVWFSLARPALVRGRTQGGRT